MITDVFNSSYLAVHPGFGLVAFEPTEKKSAHLDGQSILNEREAEAQFMYVLQSTKV